MNLSTFVSIHDIKAAVSNFNDTGQYDEKKEASRRSDAMFIGYYAENGPTYDPDGKYLCGTCKFRVGTNKCATVEGKISFTTGSCRQWYIGEAAKESDNQKNKSSQEEVLYTERPHVKAFGCSRCDYGAKAKKPDAAGRSMWCDSWGMHIISMACCERNEGKDDVHPNRIDAGGPGSGRHPYGKKFPGPEGKPAVNYRQNAPAPLYKKEFDQAEVAKEKAGQAEMRQWQQQHPVAQQKETSINKGDEVKTLKTTKAFDNDKLEFKQFKPGTTLTVINVLPKVGSNPQLMVAQYPGRQGDIVHMPVTDVRLHRTLEGIQEKPSWQIRQDIGLDKTNVRPGKIIQQVETPTGATYTKIKPESAGRPTGSGNISKQSSEHSLKGQFSPARGPKGNELKEIFTFDTRLKSFGQGTARATVWDANYKAKTPDEVKNGTNGSTVIAWRDTITKSGKVMEFDVDRNGYIKQGSKPMQSFNNLGKMAGYLKQRYGVSMKLPKK